MGNCTRHARSANSESLESKALFNGGNPAGEPVTGTYRGKVRKGANPEAVPLPW